MAKQTYGTERQWYAIHTYSGYEDAVARNLKQRIDSFSVADKIFNVVVPTEKKIKIKNGRRFESREKILKRTSGDTVRHAIDLALDDAVVIIDGPFKDLEGKVGEIDEDRGKVKVFVPMFGRETPVELEADQVQRI